MAGGIEKSQRLKDVDAIFDPGSPARMKLEIEVAELELQVLKQREMARAVTRFSALPEPKARDIGSATSALIPPEVP